jgi:predicted ABC-type ATPase
MSSCAPNVVLIAGPNGSGKSTAAPALLRDYLGITEFVNADVIAQGLSGFGSENVAMKAGRIMLDRMKELAAAEADFAFETTLASRTFAPWMEELRQAGYCAHLLFLWLPSAEMAVARVRSRVQRGGHDVPEDVVRRRYGAGLRNFFSLYRPLVNAWRMYDNSSREGYTLIASESGGDPLHIEQSGIWNSIVGAYA